VYILELTDIISYYGKLLAVYRVSLKVREKQIIGLIGPNGAGKSTILKCVMGINRISYGSIRFQEKEISRLEPHEIVERGIAYVPEGRRIFPYMSVEDNLLVGSQTRRTSNKRKEILGSVYELFPVLKERSSQPAGTLSGGEQQMLAIGRALMSSPDLLLIDEPFQGLAPRVITSLLNAVNEIVEMGKAVILADQNAVRTLSVAEYIYALREGRLILEGKSEEFKGRKEELRRIYLA